MTIRPQKITTHSDADLAKMQRETIAYYFHEGWWITVPGKPEVPLAQHLREEWPDITDTVRKARLAEFLFVAMLPVALVVDKGRTLWKRWRT